MFIRQFKKSTIMELGLSRSRIAMVSFAMVSLIMSVYFSV